MCLQIRESDLLLKFESLIGAGAVSGHPLAMKKQDDKCLKFMKSNWLTLATLAGVLVGKFSFVASFLRLILILPSQF